MRTFPRMMRRRLVRIAGDAQRRGRDGLWSTLWHAIADGVSIPRSLRPGASASVDREWRALCADPFVSDDVHAYCKRFPRFRGAR